MATFSTQTGTHLHSLGSCHVFLGILGAIVGGWGKIVGYVRAEQPADYRRSLIIFSVGLVTLAIFPALMVELRQS